MGKDKFEFKESFVKVSVVVGDFEYILPIGLW